MPDIAYKNVLILDEDDNGLIPYIPPATTRTLGLVKPDGTTITIDSNGVISSVNTGGGGESGGGGGESGGGIVGTIGSNSTFIYAENSQVKPCTLTLGDSYTPVYLNNGVFTKCSASITTGGTYVAVSDLVQTFPVISYYIGQKSWGFKFSNGILLQGGVINRLDTATTAQNIPVTLPFGNYVGVDYTILISMRQKESDTGNRDCTMPYSKTVTNSGFTLWATTAPTYLCYFNWMTIGIAES